MINKRAEIEFLYYAGMEREDVHDRLRGKYPNLSLDYVSEVCDMVDNDNFLLEDSYNDAG